MRKKSGMYELLTYNKYGALRKKREKIEYVNYLTTRAALDEYLKKHPKHSAVIVRILYNSLEHT